MICDKLTKDERSERRKKVICEILSTGLQTDIARKYNLSLGYVMHLVRQHCQNKNPMLYESLKIPDTRKPEGVSYIVGPPCVMISDIVANAEKFK